VSEVWIYKLFFGKEDFLLPYQAMYPFLSLGDSTMAGGKAKLRMALG